MKKLLPKIVFEDQHLLVINKPSGLVVNRAKTVKGRTLQDWLEESVKCQVSSVKDKKDKEFINRTGVVHRLDKETSGLMVVAKEPEVFYKLQKQFKERTVVKKYLALVHGKLQPRVGDIKAPIKRNPFNRFRFAVFIDGRAAKTVYRVLECFFKGRARGRKYFSLAEVVLKTGRTHQIRVHFSHLGYPIVSDPLYAGRKTARADRRWCPRLFLHACFLEFSHPVTRKRLKFSCKLPENLKKALAEVEKYKKLLFSIAYRFN